MGVPVLRTRETHTVKGSDAAQVHLPAHVLAVDLAHVRDIERIFLTGAALVDIDLGGTLLQNIQD
jgi:hypothetical protein